MFSALSSGRVLSHSLFVRSYLCVVGGCQPGIRHVLVIAHSPTIRQHSVTSRCFSPRAVSPFRHYSLSKDPDPILQQGSFQDRQAPTEWGFLVIKPTLRGRHGTGNLSKPRGPRAKRKEKKHPEVQYLSGCLPRRIYAVDILPLSHWLFPAWYRDSTPPSIGSMSRCIMSDDGRRVSAIST